MNVPHPIPYQGSKRNLANLILSYFPKEFDTLVEPFAGSAAISLASANSGKAKRFYLNDINKPLMSLWGEIIENPDSLASAYEKLWLQQEGKEKNFYNKIRDEFNQLPRPELFLFLLARCVKGAVRYNSMGQFNQSPDNRRKGRHPKNMKNDLCRASKLLSGKTFLTNMSYQSVFEVVTPQDLLYLDPPYQGVAMRRDSRYAQTVEFDEFVSTLYGLNERRISFILSYDGTTGEKKYGKEMPTDLLLHHIVVNAGRSAQSTLNGGVAITHESIYLSDALIERLGIPHEKRIFHLKPVSQLSFAV